jgi:hypothetical protein
MGSHRNRLVGLCALATLTGTLAMTHAPTASAQPKKPAAAETKSDAEGEDTKEQAKEAYIEASGLFKEGKFEEAVPLFEKADELFPGAAPKHKIAVCYDKLGKTQEAIDAYQTFIDSDPGEKYADRVESSKQRIAELQAQLPAKVMIVVGPEGVGATQITVDGTPAGGSELSLPAGEHTVVISAEGYQPVTEVVTVQGGEDKKLEVTLAPMAAPPPPEPATPPPPPPPPQDDGGHSNVPAYVTLGIAGAGVILGTIFGIQALGAKSDFDDDPTVENADDAERAALIADMSFGVALTFGITGAVLLFSGGDDEAPEEAASAMPELLPMAGPKGGGMAATWKF